MGTHTIKCTATKETGATASATITITVNRAKPAYAKESWTTPGTYTWTIPEGITTIKVTVAGAGGGRTEEVHWLLMDIMLMEEMVERED